MPVRSRPDFSRFDRATIEAYTKHRILAVSAGEPGSRKTSFWLEAPKPLVLFSMDRGLEGVVNRHLAEHPDDEIYVKEYDWIPESTDDAQAKAQEVRAEFEEDFIHALGVARTIVEDKETDFWRLYRFADLGPGGDEQRNYDIPNMKYRKLVNLVKSSDCNFGCIQGMQDVWGRVAGGGRGPTGARRGAGFKELVGLLHIEITHTGLSPSDWAMTIGKVRGPGNAELAGETLPMLTFPQFAMLCFPDTDESDWS